MSFWRTLAGKELPTHIQATDWDAAGSTPLSLRPGRRVPPESVLAPTRSGRDLSVSVEDALSIDATFRCVSILATMMGSMPVKSMRAGKEMKTAHPLIRRPELEVPRRVTVMNITTSMATWGESFLHLPGREFPSGPVNAISVLNPGQVQVTRNYEKGHFGELVYRWNNQATRQNDVIPSHQIAHLRLFHAAGELRGTGPIQRVQTAFRAAIDCDRYQARWFSDSELPTGYLTTEQVLSKELQDAYRDRWTDLLEERRIIVLSNGLQFKESTLKPAEALFVEISQFNSQRICRVFGVPAVMADSSYLAESATYSNQSQKNQMLLTTTLINYIGAIETAMNEILPAGTTWEFDTDSLTTDLDAPRRFQGYALATGGKAWNTVNEIRDKEGDPPLPGGDELDMTAPPPVPLPAVPTTPLPTNGKVPNAVS